MAKVVGIIGGMGPLATVDLMRKIVLRTPAERDQDHLHVIVDSYPQIPDRVAAILQGGEDPTPALIESARRLVAAGAEVLAMACNTAHHFLPALEDAVPVPFVHMPREVARALQEKGVRRAWLMASTATVATGLYQAPLAASGIATLVPPDELQQAVQEGIRAVKRGELARGRDLFASVIHHAAQHGAEAVIAGCTEIPAVIRPEDEPLVVDPTDILAEAIVREAQVESAQSGALKEVIHGIRR
ncbi:amino acid racemase [Alicyclobacillus sp.]|uniref:aspartate/glutamate racemase family protein n=1 Tax=Alicyclobacillus sp. TaxID=61169 RepID=UPI0025C71018|nr:amino acid racemase [Alicyclobacillus sp.]MCL6517919.1 amino acid racemase [Alicyclobacillus sp.]